MQYSFYDIIMKGLVILMSKIIFTDSQVKKLSKNKYIKNVSNKSITYTEDFKMKLYFETVHNKKAPAQVFIDCGLDPKLIGMNRIHSLAHLSKKKFIRSASLADTRTTNSGRKHKKAISDKELLDKAFAKIKLLEAENELLKKNALIDLGIITDLKQLSDLN